MKILAEVAILLLGSHLSAWTVEARNGRRYPARHESKFQEQFPLAAHVFPVVVRETTSVEAFGFNDDRTVHFFVQASIDESADAAPDSSATVLLVDAQTGEVISDFFCSPCAPDAFSLTTDGLVVTFISGGTRLTFVNAGLSFEERSTFVRRLASRFGFEQRFFVEELVYSGAVSGVVEGLPVRAESIDDGAGVLVSRVIERHPKAAER
jgi:hypothetical protein